MRLGGIVLDRRSGEPLARQLVAALRRAIREGRLAAHERLISTRELQTHLGVSRNTILNAFEQLHAEGYLRTVRGVGTFVADVAPQRTAREREPQRPIAVSPEAKSAVAVSELAENAQLSVPFRPGVPDIAAFPLLVFRRCFRPERWDRRSLDYPHPQGIEMLREAIAARVRQTRGLDCTADRIFITAGAQPAFALAVRTLLHAGDRAIVEDPCYPNIRAVLGAHGVRTVAAPVDANGVRVESFARKRAQLAYVTPSHQYPSGAVLSLERRFALLDWAAANGAWIVEDDYDSEFNYTGRPQPALCALERDGRVLYVGTFSKVLSPALRLGYIVAPAALCAPLRAMQTVSGGVPDAFAQMTLGEFIASGHFGRHVTKMRKLYDERRNFTAARFARSGLFQVDDSRAGLHFIAELPRSVDDRRLSERAAREGLIVPALSGYFAGEKRRRGLVIGYAATAPAEAAKAVGVLERLTESA